MPEIIGYCRLGGFGIKVDKRCTECSGDFETYDRVIREGEDFECTYCGSDWRTRSQHEKELKTLDNLYATMTSAQYKAAMRDLFRRACEAENAKVAEKIEDWAKDLDACSPDLPSVWDYIREGMALVETREYHYVISREYVPNDQARKGVEEARKRSESDGQTGWPWYCFDSNDTGVQWSRDGEMFTTITYGPEEN